MYSITTTNDNNNFSDNNSFNDNINNIIYFHIYIFLGGSCGDVDYIGFYWYMFVGSEKENEVPMYNMISKYSLLLVNIKSFLGSVYF